MSFARRHPDVTFGVAALVLLAALTPLLRTPTYAFLLVAALAGGAVAWRWPSIPLALAAIPPIVDAVFGHDPLPSGGFTLLFSAWIMAGVGFAVVRGDNPLALRTTFTSASVLASVALLGVMVSRLGVSPDQGYGSTKVQLYAADVVIILIGAVFAGSKRASLRLFVLALLATDGTGALLFLFKLVSGSAHLQFSGRYSLASAEYPIDMGRASSDGLLVAIFCVISMTGRARIIAGAFAPPLAIALISAGSRGPVLAFAVGLVTLVGLTATSPAGRRRLTSVVVLAAVAILLVPLVVPTSSLARALSTIIGSASGLSSNGRSQLWMLALTVFDHHLWLGWGTGGDATLVTGLQYPHNLLLEIASELGLLGLAVLVTVLGGFVAALSRCWHRSSGDERLVATLVIAMFASAFVNAQFSDPIQGNGSVWLWGGLAIGMAARLAR